MVERKIEFTVKGKPVGKPRMTRRDKWAKRPCVTRYWEWKDSVRDVAQEVPDANTVTDLSWTAYITMPKSWSKKKRAEMDGQLHRSKPDRDNIDKALLDALYDDDSGIARGTVEKVWAEEGRLDVVITFEDSDSMDGEKL